MPIYEYECPMHGVFEDFHSINSKLENCPHCKEEHGVDQPVEKVLSLPSPGVMILSGQEYKEKLKSDGKAFKKKMYSDESTYANTLGESTYQNLQTKIDNK